MAEFRKILHIHIDRSITDHIQAKQNDTNSRFLDCQLFQPNGIPYDLTRHKIRVAILKPDGRHVFNNGKLTRASEGMFAVELTTQTLSVVGIVVAEVKIYTEDEKSILTTKTFEIEVMKEIWDEEAIESSNEFGAVVQLFQDVWEVRQSIFGMEKSVGTPRDDLSSGHSSVSDTIFGGLNKIWNHLLGVANIWTQTIANRIDATISSRATQTSVNAVVPAVNSARDNINTNINNRFNSLSQQINFVTPNYITVRRNATQNVTSAILITEFAVYTGRGALNNITVSSSPPNIHVVTIITESIEQSANVSSDGTLIGLPSTSIHFSNFLRVRLSHGNTTRVSYNAIITIPE